MKPPFIKDGQLRIPKTITVYVLYDESGDQGHTRPLDVTASLEEAIAWEHSGAGHDFDRFEVDLTK
jgi:hypothetical protein